MRGVSAHKDEIDISFSASRGLRARSRPRGIARTSAQRPDNDLVSDDSRAFCVSPGERRRRAHWIIRPYTAEPARRVRRCVPGQVRGNEGDDTLSTGRMLIGRARQGFSPGRSGRVRGKRARRDRPTGADKLSAPLYKAQRRASCAPLPASENGTLVQRGRFARPLTQQRFEVDRFVRGPWNNSLALLSRLYI